MKASDSYRSGLWYAMAMLALAAMIIGLAYSLWTHTERLFLADRLSQESPQSGPGNTELIASRKSDRAHLIPGWHLFGQTQSPAAAKPKPVEAPKTRLNLRLKGVLSSDDTENARAIILVPGKPEKAYKTGDQLPGGASIAEIRAEGALLKRGDRFETLPLDKLQPDADEREESVPRGPRRVLRTIQPASAPGAAEQER